VQKCEDLVETLSVVPVNHVRKRRSEPSKVNGSSFNGCPSFCPTDWYSDMVLAFMILSQGKIAELKKADELTDYGIKKSKTSFSEKKAKNIG
jgi:hypothetical protein